MIYWLISILWHINLCKLFNAKSSLYTFCPVDRLKVNLFLNVFLLICLQTVKLLHVFQTQKFYLI